VDLSDVIKRIIEENQVHGLVLEAVVFKHAVHLSADFSPVTQVFVKTGVFLLFISGIRFSVVTEQDRVLEGFLLNILEVLLDETANNTVDDKGLVLVVQETISEHTHAFVSPQTDELGLGCYLVLGGEQ